MMFLEIGQENGKDVLIYGAAPNSKYMGISVRKKKRSRTKLLNQMLDTQLIEKVPILVKGKEAQTKKFTELLQCKC